MSGSEIMAQASSTYATFKFLTGFLFSILLTVMGVVLYKHGRKYRNWIRTTAEVTESECNESSRDYDTGKVTYTCVMEVKYNGEVVGTLRMVSDKKHLVGENVNVMYDPNNKESVEVQSMNTETIGKWVIGGGVFSASLSLLGVIYCISGGCAGVGAVMAVSDTTSAIMSAYD